MHVHQWTYENFNTTPGAPFPLPIDRVMLTIIRQFGCLLIVCREMTLNKGHRSSDTFENFYQIAAPSSPTLSTDWIDTKCCTPMSITPIKELNEDDEKNDSSNSSTISNSNSILNIKRSSTYPPASFSTTSTSSSSPTLPPLIRKMTIQ